MPLRFNIVFSLYQGLKQQFEEEAKEREKKEKEAQGQVDVPSIGSITSQATSAMSNLPKYNIPSMGSISIPH